MRNQLTLWYRQKQIHRGARGGYYWRETNKKRYWTHRRVEFVCRRPPPKQDYLPPDLWRIVWQYKESIDNYLGCNATFMFLLPYADRRCLRVCSNEGELAIEAAIRLYPPGSHVARKAQRLAANF